MSKLKHLRLQLASVLLCTTILHACSGGGGDGGGIGGSGIQPVINADLSYGTITGFGSVIINGQRYNTNQTEFVIDGVTGVQADLALGMVVSADVDFDQLTAERVSYEPTVLGPIASIDAATNRINILGQTIIASTVTVLDGFTLPELRPGDFIQLTGNRDTDGAVRATWIARSPSSDHIQVTGTVTDLQAGEGRFSIGQLSVDYTSTDLSSLNTNLSNSLSVIVAAPIANLDIPSVSLAAATIDNAALGQMKSGQRIDIEGIVSEVQSGNRFVVDGRTVLTDAKTLFQLVGGASTSPAAINRDTHVEIEGSVEPDGTIQATSVIVIPGDESRLIGRIESLDSDSQMLTVLGIDVGTTTRTRYDIDEGGSGAAGFARLGIGSYVEIDASFINNTLIAARIKIDEPDEDARMRGPVTRLDVNGSVLEVLGVPLIDNGDTDYENLSGQEVDRNGFLQGLRIGDLVEARWREFQSTALPPDDVEMED